MENLAQHHTNKTRLFYIYTPEYVKTCARLPSNEINNDDDTTHNRSYLVHSLIHAYSLFDKMTLVRPQVATISEITKFHSQSYIDTLMQLDKSFQKLQEATERDEQSDSESESSSEEEDENGLDQKRIAHGLDDAPYFPGICEYIQNVAGGSISAARMVIAHHDKQPIAFNWEGGRHHARASRASGFCYVNDVVLCILELLRKFRRVLCVDIDVHHGDGVEEAFYFSNRVMTVSLHQFGPGLYPGTGDIDNIGRGRGTGYNVNIPLNEGVRDDKYTKLFEEIVINTIVPKFKPEVIVLVCGADSMHGDPLGNFNLTVDGYAKCASMIRNLKLPTVVLGAGGYNAANTARCFATVTAAMISDDPLDNDIPEHNFYEYYKDNGFERRTTESKTPDRNTNQDVDQLREKILKNNETYVK
jgi:acetoin utilization deacetylase AcuC-like enzyme